MEPIFTITELARDLDVTPRAIRLYEDKGLLHPRRAGKTRVFGRADRDRLERILRGKRLGMSLREIRELLALRDSPNGTSQVTPEQANRIRRHIEHLEQQRADLEATLGELREIAGHRLVQ